MRNNILFRVLCASSIVAFSCPGSNAQGTIHTVAGDCYSASGYNYTIPGKNIAGYTADGAAQAASKVFSSPGGVITDAAGNIYIADYNKHSMYMVSPTGTISSVAGTGVYGYTSMDGLSIVPGADRNSPVFADYIKNHNSTDFFAYCAYGANHANHLPLGDNNSKPATGERKESSSLIEFPKGVWKDKSDNLYIADQGNNRVCKINAGTNTLRTITGGNARGFSPDGTPAASCQWGSISGLCADNNGNVYVSDRINHVVRVIDTNGNVRTIAGTGVSGYSGDGGFALSATLRTPGCLFLNSAGNLFICDPLSNVVRVMNVNNPSSIMETLAGNGKMGYSGDGDLASTAKLNYPVSVWQDPTGTIYISDMGNLRVRAVSQSNYAKDASVAFNIFPNPSTGSFNLLLTNTLSGSASLEVFNVLGEKVHGETINQQQTTVKLNQPAGVYDVVVKSGNTSTSQKIVIGK